VNNRGMYIPRGDVSPTKEPREGVNNDIHPLSWLTYSSISLPWDMHPTVIQIQSLRDFLKDLTIQNLPNMTR